MRVAWTLSKLDTMSHNGKWKQYQKVACCLSPLVPLGTQGLHGTSISIFVGCWGSCPCPYMFETESFFYSQHSLTDYFWLLKDETFGLIFLKLMSYQPDVVINYLLTWGQIAAQISYTSRKSLGSQGFYFYKLHWCNYCLQTLHNINKEIVTCTQRNTVAYP